MVTAQAILKLLVALSVTDDKGANDEGRINKGTTVELKLCSLAHAK
jgi:hypothetical protein